MTTADNVKQLSSCMDARAMLVRAREEGIETVWDRLAAQQPQCGYCALGVSCRNCAMGPCRVDPFGDQAGHAVDQRGRLARARPGHDQQRSPAMCYGLSLLRIQAR